MKLNALSRSTESAVRRDRRDIRRVHRNRDPAQHPFQRAREYTRALNATKLERAFAHPFVRALDGHSDGVYCLEVHPGAEVSAVLSGSCDGEVRLWNASHGVTQWKAAGHDGFVRDLSALATGQQFLSCGDDQRIKLWALDPSTIVTGSGVRDSLGTGLLLHETAARRAAGGAGSFGSAAAAAAAAAADAAETATATAAAAAAAQQLDATTLAALEQAASIKQQQQQQQQQRRGKGEESSDEEEDDDDDPIPEDEEEEEEFYAESGASGPGGRRRAAAGWVGSGHGLGSGSGEVGQLGDSQLTWTSNHAVTGVSASWDKQSTTFVSCGGEEVSVWDLASAEPVRTIQWGTEAVTGVYFNPVETSLFASTGTERTIALYDLRAGSGSSGGVVRKVALQMNSNVVAWNPMEAFNFTVGCDDHMAYTFDMRKLDRARCTHEGHTAAVMDVHWSPNGQEFVTASYDRTIRIFQNQAGHSRDVYYTKRMQRVFSARFSPDARFIYSGSDDTNIRVWKARAADNLKPGQVRQERSAAYADALKEQFAHAPEIKRISRQRRIPSVIRKDTKVKKIMKQSRQRRTRNIVAHSKPGTVVPPAEREKVVDRIAE